ncbi:MAG: electron transfer flavoprotein subunit alpha/FixB family protein [Candidatus Omnitrophica bacterium]|nr:electron transfer flavoprotein subunit alpha/FixB family protein [Candidatus Omnitrophota bacterium]
MSGKNSILVFVEQSGDKIACVSIELISKAVRLASELKVDVTAVAIGHGLKDRLGSLGNYGCNKVYCIEDKRLAHFTAVPYGKITAQVIKKYKPQIVLFGATTTGRSVAPRVASELKCGLTADCTDLQIGSHKIMDTVYENILMQIRPAFGGNIIATIVSPESSPSMATVREGVMIICPPDRSRSAEIVPEECKLKDSDFLTEVMEVVNEEKKVDLKSTNIVVSAGMGASSPGSLALVKELAHTLGGELGCSRVIVDTGILHKDHQVGQTGITVRPKLYIACGISGQVQHRAGMSESKRIIAINSDPHAPIFKIAHYGIVGDLNEIIPKMIKAYKGEIKLVC